MVLNICAIIIFLFGQGLIAVSCSAREDTANHLTPVTLQLRWFHQFQFAGFYAAKEKGYYKQQGLDVVIREGDSSIDTVNEVVSGRAQFGVTNSEILISRLWDKKEVVVIAPIFQHSPLVFIARKETNITHPQDFIGRRVRISRSIRDLELHATLFNEGVGLDQIEMVDGPGRKEYLFDPAIDVTSAYITNEPYYLIEKGIEFNVIRPTAYGVDFYGDSIFASEKWTKKHPDMVNAFKDASIMGWEYAMANKQELIDLILKKYNSRKSRAHLLYEANAIENLILQDLIEIGHNNAGRWDSIAKVFVKHGVVDKDYSLEGFIFSPDEKQGTPFLWGSIAVLIGIAFLTSMISAVLYKFNNRLNREIKEKQESRTALAQSEARLKAMFENINSGVAIYSAMDDGQDFRVNGLNKAAQRIENVSLEKVIGKPVTQVFPGIKKFGLFDVFKRVYLTGNPEHMPVSLYKDKRIVGWRENYVYRLPSGEIAAVYNDETVRKKAQIHRKHLDTVNHIIINTRHSQQMLQDLLDSMLEIFSVDQVWLLYPCDPDSDTFTISVQSCRPGCPGIKSSETEIAMDKQMARSMKTVLNINGPIEYDDQSSFNTMVDPEAGYPVKSELRMAIYPKFDKAWMLGMCRCQSDSPWESEDKQLLNTIGRRISDGLNAILLIRELQKTNKTLRESEDRFARIFNASPVGILIAAKDKLQILNTNESLCNITGFCQEDLFEKSLLDEDLFIDRESRSAILAIQKNEFYNNLDIRFNTARNEIRNGRLSSQSVNIGDSQCIIITIEDITEYKQAQQEKLLAHKHAAEQEKYALIGQVAGKMAHDFNNILGAIMGNTELSLLDCKEPGIQKTLELILE